MKLIMNYASWFIWFIFYKVILILWLGSFYCILFLDWIYLFILTFNNEFIKNWVL
jgi:hypothetical protein